MSDVLYSEIKNCRVCGCNELTEVLNLGVQALTGIFPKQRETPVDSGPVALVACTSDNGCGLVQLKQSYSPKLMYGENYGYRSGLNASMVSHLNSKVSKIEETISLESGDVVLDVGSNDATTLHAYTKRGLVKIGIDPSAKKFEHFYSSDMRLIIDFFTMDTVKKIFRKNKARVITSFSMFYDLEDPVEFVRAIKLALSEDGLWVLEQSYLGAMLKTNSFDTVCHEHLEFYGLKQIDYITKRVGLKIIDVEFNEVNGGSSSITVAHETSAYKVSNTVAAVLSEEESANFSSPLAFENFKKRVDTARDNLIAFLTHAKSSGKVIYGLGASTKGNVLLQYFGINESLLPKIAEVNSDKYGCYTPGTGIPIISEELAINENPDYFLVLPWHFKTFFVGNRKFSSFKLVFPLPEFEVWQSTT